MSSSPIPNSPTRSRRLEARAVPHRSRLRRPWRLLAWGLIGGLAGGGSGAAIGAIAGGVGGAAIGAVAGAVIGAAVETSREQQAQGAVARANAQSDAAVIAYRDAMKSCLAARGYSVQ